MAFPKETWAAQAYLAKSKYAGQFLPTLNKYRPDMAKGIKWHLTTIGALTGQYNDYGSTTVVTYTSAGGETSAIDLETKDTALKGFELDDDEINSTDINLISEYVTQSNKAIMNQIEKSVALDMAINCASGNKIELASGNQITLANLQTMEKNILDNGGDLENNYILVNPTYLINLQNVVDTNNVRLFLNKEYINQDFLQKGVIGQILSFKVLLSHNLPTLNDAGTAYDAAGETAMVYYNADAFAVGIQTGMDVEVDRVTSSVPVVNNVLVKTYTGKAMVASGLAGHIREYSA